MDGTRKRTLIFCTAYTHAAAGSFYTWEARYRTWVDAIRSSALAYDQLLLIDDGSASLPDWPDLQIVREADDLQTVAPLVMFHFDTHLGRRAVSDFPGWVRSYFFAATFARANGFEKIVHIEADAFLISRRMQVYVNDFRDGWGSLFCPLFIRPESAIQIIAGASMDSFAAFARQPVDALAGAVIETTIPFTHVETGFAGDRYGEYLEYVPAHADWCAQAVPKGNLPLHQYFWWIPRPAGAAPVPASNSLPPTMLKEPPAALAHSGLWYTDFFWHFDKAMRPATYLEIGTNKGHSLRKFSCDAVCVDPHFLLEAEVLGARRRAFFFQGTSDDFFAGDDLSKCFPSGVDVAFLDGLHHAEVVLRDFINAERYSRDRTVFFIHDCLPLNARMAAREWVVDEAEDEATRGFWTGDTWKLMVALKAYRPDLTIHYLDCGPSGLAVCQGLDRRSTILSDRYDKIVDLFAGLSLETFGLDALWRLFPTIDSRRLLDGNASFAQTFGPPWTAARE
jgi:hypothetical protein